jgi:predicted polyphosphate/ATP-dependent NAD kinase
LSLVGIIANPDSGRDIRRVVSLAAPVGNQQKINVLRRLLQALSRLGVSRVEIMPDLFGLGRQAMDALADAGASGTTASLIDMSIEGGAQDSVRAAEYLRAAGASCIVVLGGDGTCRVVAKGCGEVPLVPISTGTNNVVPYLIEGTVAGLAAAYLALRPDVPRDVLCWRHKKLLIRINGRETDQALVDVTLVTSQFVGSKAVWEPDVLRQVFVTRAQPSNIGLSALIGVLHPIGPAEAFGATARVQPNGRQVLAPIAPGRIASIGIGELVTLAPGVAHPVLDERPAILALDGEREIVLHAGDRAEVMLTLEGPWIVDVERTLNLAVDEGTFRIS